MTGIESAVPHQNPSPGQAGTKPRSDARRSVLFRELFAKKKGRLGCRGHSVVPFVLSPAPVFPRAHRWSHNPSERPPHIPLQKPWRPRQPVCECRQRNKRSALGLHSRPKDFQDGFRNQDRVPRTNIISPKHLKKRWFLGEPARQLGFGRKIA